MMLHNDKNGFTLIELIVVMAIFISVIMISASAFERITTVSSQQSKSAETQIAGLIGLEILRADLEQTGFGLPWAFSSTTIYDEASEENSQTGLIRPTGKDYSTYNDSPTNAPRAIQSDATTFNLDGGGIGSNYLVIKSMLSGGNDTCRKWSTIAVNNAGKKSRKVWETLDREFLPTDQVIIIKDALNTTPPTRQLLSSGGVFSGTFAPYSSPQKDQFQNGDTFVIYGVTPDTPVRFPFNRVDYYVTRPPKNIESCAPNTGVLYKSITSQKDGKLGEGVSVLDCVADMQVVYGLDTSGGGWVNQYWSAPANTVTPSAADIRSQLREIRVYILAQEGKKDRLYTYPTNSVLVGEVLEGVQRGRTFSLNDMIGPDYKHYRWKVYTIVVRPKNLIQ